MSGSERTSSTWLPVAHTIPVLGRSIDEGAGRRQMKRTKIAEKTAILVPPLSKGGIIEYSV
jgi:hypothetical protein